MRRRDRNGARPSPAPLAALSALALAAGLAAPAPARAGGFDWIGKVDLYADGLRSKDPEQRLEAVRRLGKSEVRWARPHLLRALRDPDIRVAGAAGKILARGKVREAVPIVVPWLASTSVEAQQAAAEILGELGDPRAIPQLIRSIGNQDPQVRVRVVNALGRIGTGAVVVPLIDRLDDDKAEVRLATVEQLMATGDRRAVIPLVGLFTEPSIEVRVAAVTAVGRLGDRAALPALLRLLRDPNEQIKKAAVTALGNLEAAEATDTLVQLLQTGSDSFRAEVAFALGHIARSAAAGESGREALDTLVESLASGQLRAAATEALTAAGRTAVPALIAHLQGKLDGDPATVVALLRDIGDPRATPALVSELDRGRLSKELVLDALRVLGDTRALVPVLGLVSDKDPAVRLAAMRALRPLLGKGSRAADVIGDLLDDPELEIRIMAAEYLGLMGADVAIPALQELAAARAGELRLREAAISALGEIGQPRATPTLLAILRTGPASLQLAAANALIYIQDPASVGPLLAMVDDAAGSSSRAAVVRTLGGVLRDRRADAARRALEHLATDATLDVSLSAIASLGAMADPASRDALLGLARGGQIDRRRAAVEALGNLPGPADGSLASFLMDQLRSTDDRVAASAAWSLGKRGVVAARPVLARACRRRGFATPIDASAALALLADRSDARAVIELFAHRSRLVRANAVFAAGRLRLADARAGLIVMATSDPSWLVRVAAVRALSRLGGGADALRRAARRDAHEEVRAAAVAGQKAPFRAPARTDWREFYFVDPTSGDHPVEQEPYFVSAADGLVTALYTDARGESLEERFPPGPYLIASAMEEKEY
ncbi:MAG TPA: HEAT repeat domain-containing protein [Kofleriaceae bacterium]|nr:HEAT repeat domain-containing protein [Kofleriaceae bacterium]